jgi:hypothetical protein
VNRRGALQWGAVAWAAVGGGIALGSLGEVDADARVLVGAASVVGPLAALTAAW